MGDPPVALTIAGSDSAAGAGIQADLKTMAALGVFGTTAVTAVTAQNTARVIAVHPVPPEIVDAQIGAVVEDLAVRATKTGMLASAATVAVVAARAARGELGDLVIDPVLVASTGRPLLDAEGIHAVRRLLLPHALVVTPNLWEAALLADVDVADLVDIDAMEVAARRIHGFGAAWVLVKGGHLPGVEVDLSAPDSDELSAPSVVPDVLFDGEEVTVLSGDRVVTANTHGTGCSLSAALTAELASGADVADAAEAAKAYVTVALRGGAAWLLGEGHGPLDHFGWAITELAPPIR